MEERQIVKIQDSCFNQEISLPENQQLLSMIEKQISRTCWNIGKNLPQPWEKMFKLMRSSKVDTINFTKYNHPNLIKDIIHISFSHLKNLYLYENNILSIQAFILIDANLLELRFGDNLIVQMRSLRKANFPFIKDLRFHRNRIYGLEFLKEVMCHQKMQELTFESLKKDPLHSDSLQALFKMEATRMLEIECYSDLRVSWKKIEKMIFNKFGLTSINGQSRE